MASATLVARTPHRLRYLVTGNDEGTTLTLANATLLADARGCQPLFNILQTPVADQAEARQLLLGVGAAGSVFNPYITGKQHCRVRALLRTFDDIDQYLSADANVGSGQADLVLQIAVNSTNDTSWYLDLEVEYSTIQ